MSKDLNLSNNICFLGKVDYDDLSIFLTQRTYMFLLKSDAGIASQC